MYILIALVFVLGYTAIALEHPLKINKAATAVLTGMLIWTMIMLGHHLLFTGEHGGTEHLLGELMEHLSDIASILFFLIGAMTVVELMDAHEGFRVITDRIKSTNRLLLLWVLGFIAFFLSAALDNMTTSIVMAALLRKFIKNKEDLWTFAGMVIIAANAGGAWSPIGDVTTIMLWIGGQVTTMNIIVKLILPSLVCLVLPLTWLSFTSRGKLELLSVPDDELENDPAKLTKGEKYLVFFLGLGTLLGVPIFKNYTHLPPFMGIMLGLGVLWVVTEIIHMRHPRWRERDRMTVSTVLKNIDHSSILFFLGILVAVAGLQVAGHLGDLAHFLDTNLSNIYAINGIIGVLSAIVDNVPLVAAAMGMYPMTEFPQDHAFWELLALCAGTGGSILIIGSAAGVAVMGILGIDFIWYLKRMSIPALLGYLGGILTFWLLW
ncbi:MAG: sodium:proton antiporter NhaD [Flavobacteriales bacterium]|nr:sodium:proton antiporter NhaD [Flavobacteriales bacterium]MCB9168098.1 sodium:proton antiporter NhaD [Flavobacteriales bacterium]